MNVELVVLDLDGGEMLRRCLDSIERQTERPLRVIIFDNGSREPVAGRIGTRNRVEVVRSVSNLGFTGAINRAMQEVRADYVGWVNNDVELDPEWLAVLRRALDADPQLAGVQPIILAPDRRVDGAGIDISSGRFLQAAHRAALSDPRKPAWGISATASLYRTAALRASAIGGEILHPAFFAYYEDVELCARLRATGWTMEVVERPLAIHAGSSTAPSLGRLATRLRTRNRYWVWRLWKVGRLAALLLEDARLIARDLISVRAGEAAVRCAAILAGLFAAPRGKVM